MKTQLFLVVLLVAILGSSCSKDKKTAGVVVNQDEIKKDENYCAKNGVIRQEEFDYIDSLVDMDDFRSHNRPLAVCLSEFEAITMKAEMIFNASIYHLTQKNLPFMSKETISNRALKNLRVLKAYATKYAGNDNGDIACQLSSSGKIFNASKSFEKQADSLEKTYVEFLTKNKKEVSENFTSFCSTESNGIDNDKSYDGNLYFTTEEDLELKKLDHEIRIGKLEKVLRNIHPASLDAMAKRSTVRRHQVEIEKINIELHEFYQVKYGNETSKYNQMAKDDIETLRKEEKEDVNPPNENRFRL